MTTKQAQCLLLYLGYPVGAPDGITGSQTRQAVKLFQAAEGLTADGDPGQETQTALLAAIAAGRMYAPTKTENAETGTFWDEIQYFRRAEFRCQCGGKYCNGFPAEPVEETVRLADESAAGLGSPECEFWRSVHAAQCRCGRRVEQLAPDRPGH